MSEAPLLAEITDADIALITRELQLRLRARFPGLESVVAFDATGEHDARSLDATRRMLVLWLTYGDAGDAGDADALAHPHEKHRRPALTDEERASCVADAIFTESAECTVCLQPHAAHAAQVRCGHTFCRPCIAEWLERARTCPLCRIDVLCD